MRREKLIVLALGILAIYLAGCGGDGDGGSGGDGGGRGPNGTFTLNGGLRTNYTEASSATAPFGLDPDMFGEFDTGLGGTEVWLFDGHSLGTPPCCWNEIFFLAFQGSSPGSFSFAADTAFAVYGTAAGVFAGDFFTAGSSGTVNITTVGNVGGRVQGTFAVTLCIDDGFTLNCVAGSKVLSGSFDVTREPNGSGNPGRTSISVGGGLSIGIADEIQGMLKPQNSAD